jgi:ParB family chromosome partitioning protein
MSKRHDALFDEVVSGLETKSARPPRDTNRFLRRSSALAEHASGAVIEKTLHRIDPARCRMWEGHNRRYDLLDEENCADLIEGIKAQGGQEFPAIVRPLPAGDSHDYEVICGARRHWTISWLRANSYPQFRFLVEVRELTDEEAFRLADIENRDRRDITDHERALDYARACDLYYAGHQGRMAARLEVSNAWLSRYLDLARLPEEIVAAYGRLEDLREHHARRLKPVLAGHIARQAVLKAAGRLAAEQARLKAAGAPRIPGPKVLAALMTAGQPARTPPAPLSASWEGPDGLRVTARRPAAGARITVTIDGADQADQAVLERLAAWLGGRLAQTETAG